MHRTGIAFTLRFFKHFLQQEYAGGVILFLAALCAIIAANSPFQDWYHSLLGTLVEIRIGELVIAKPLLLWVNDGLMAIFFFHVGLEIKREIIAGKLASPSVAVFPVVAAIGGIVVPAAVYVLINFDNPVALQGWAIPTATDIAFALGILALLGDRIPQGLKIFLLSLAVLDDLCAVLIIAFFYTASLSLYSLAIAGVCISFLAVFNRLRLVSLVPYLLIGVVLWGSVLKSGIHASLAGALLAMFIPYSKRNSRAGATMLEELEWDLKNSAYLVILPLFAFANSGIDLTGISPASLLRPVPLAIVCGLFLGKQLGVFLFSLAAVKLGLARLPDGVRWRQLYGVSLLCGTGFTMSLFISSLAFTGNMASMIDDRLGIIAGSLLSGLAGYACLYFTTAPKS